MRTKQVRPEKKEFEFELLITKNYDKINEKEYLNFKFLTTKIFSNFIYKINVTPLINTENKEITFIVEGLSAPVLSLSKSGRAEFDFRLYDFKITEYTLKLIKPDIEKNIYKMKITKNSIKFLKIPTKKFIKVII